MLRYFRKWGIALKRRRLRRDRDRMKRYALIEADTRGEGNRCSNCNAPLTGPFCHICGQRDDDLRRPIWTFFRELFDAIFDTDSKIIKTILMLVCVPGGLSRAFLEGKRARYVPPFRLYVILLFIFFSVLSLGDILILDIQVQPKAETVAAREALEAQIEEAERVRDNLDDIRDQARQEVEHSQKEADTGGEAELASNAPTTMPDTAVPPNVDPADMSVENALEEAQKKLDTALAEKQVASLIQALEVLEREQEGAADDVEDFLKELRKRLDDLEGAGVFVDFDTAREQAELLLEDPETELSTESRQAVLSFLSLSPGALASVADSADDGGVVFGNLPYEFEFSMFVPNSGGEREGIKQEDIDFILEDPETPDIVKKATEGFMEGLRSPREFNKLFNDWLPWALVFLMPVFAVILSLTHWGKRRYYLNQLVFALHFHSFLFVMLTVFAIVVPIVGGEGAFDIFWIATSVYLIIALKVGQKQGWIRAFLKAGFIWVSYFIIMMWTMAAVMFFGISDSSVGEFLDLVQNANGEVTVSDPSPPTEN